MLQTANLGLFITIYYTAPLQKNPSAGRISARLPQLTFYCYSHSFGRAARAASAKSGAERITSERAPTPARNKLRNQWRRGQPYERHKKVKYNAAERFEGHTFSGDHIKLATISHGSSASRLGARPKISAGGRGERISRDAIIHARPECVQIHCRWSERERKSVWPLAWILNESGRD
jgi:hypothetical protein